MLSILKFPRGSLSLCSVIFLLKYTLIYLFYSSILASKMESQTFITLSLKYYKRPLNSQPAPTHSFTNSLFHCDNLSEVTTIVISLYCVFMKTEFSYLTLKVMHNFLPFYQLGFIFYFSPIHMICPFQTGQFTSIPTHSASCQVCFTSIITFFRIFILFPGTYQPLIHSIKPKLNPTSSNSSNIS